MKALQIFAVLLGMGFCFWIGYIIGRIDMATNNMKQIVEDLKKSINKDREKEG